MVDRRGLLAIIGAIAVSIAQPQSLFGKDRVFLRRWAAAREQRRQFCCKVARACAFIRHLPLRREASQLPIGQEPSGDTARTGHASAIIAAGSMLVTGDVCERDKQYAANSMALAQLAANARYVGEFHVEEWNQFYVEVLRNIGFIGEPLRFVEYIPRGDTFTLGNDVIQAICGDDAARAGTLLIPAFRALADLPEEDQRARLFEAGRESAHKGAVRLMSLRQDLVLKVAVAYYSSSKVVSNIISDEFRSGETRWFIATTELVLDPCLSSCLQCGLLTKLGATAREFLRELDVADRRKNFVADKEDARALRFR